MRCSIASGQSTIPDGTEDSPILVVERVHDDGDEDLEGTAIRPRSDRAVVRQGESKSVGPCQEGRPDGPDASLGHTQCHKPQAD